MLNPYNISQVSFELKNEIGHEGKNSQVFLARDIHMDADLVIKRIPQQKFVHEDDYFVEARLLYRGRHSHVVPIHYASKDNDFIYLAMPYYKNGSLKSLIESRFLTVREIIRYSTHFLTGLHNIHSKGLIHFDVKPDNILLSDSDEALLSDFGLAKATDNLGIAETDRTYFKQRPPEAFNGSHFTRAFDIYQVGVTLHRLCNGNEAFYAQFNAYMTPAGFDRHRFRTDVLNGQFPNRGGHLHHIPERLRRVIKKCLQIDPADRYSSVIHLLNDIADIDTEGIDWKYEENNGTRTWSKSEDNREYCLEISPDGSSHATKKVNGPAQKIRQFCQPNIKPDDIKTFLRTN